MTTFWRNWLRFLCVGIAVFGLVMLGTGWPASDGAARAVFALFGSPLPVEPDRYLRFTASLIGAVTLGWAVVLYAAFRALWALDHATAAPIWRALTLGAVIWYVTDSAASIANGFALNAVSNTLIMALLFVPVLQAKVLVARP